MNFCNKIENVSKARKSKRFKHIHYCIRLNLRELTDFAQECNSHSLISNNLNFLEVRK